MLPLVVVGLLCLFAALHPFFSYPLSLLALRRLRARPLQPSATAELEPDLAILMCAYNEEHVIGAKLANLLALKARYPRIALYVYVDAATDRTEQILRAYEDQLTLWVSKERTGKTPGMNRLMAMVQKPIVLFTDANVMIDLDAPAKLMRYFADPTVGCVAGHLHYTNAGASVTAASGSAYWQLEEWIKRQESATGSCMGADGSLFAIRRELHSPPPAEVCDDMHVSMRLLCDGYRVVQAHDVDAFEESVTSSREEFHRKVRIACQSFNVHQALWPALRRLDAIDVYKYLSHKWLRWHAIFFLFAALVCFELALVVAGRGLWAAASLTAGAVLLSVGYLGWVKLLARAWDVLTALAGTGLGVLRSRQGHKYQTWTPAASIRK
jgi:cellulose synthase/poly-beta-1,6-N-acetylglucosamine synthase-like glycosyltransferase